MALQMLNERKTRRVAEVVGVEVVKAWATGPNTPTWGFVTSEHEHGWYNSVSKAWGWDNHMLNHFDVCDELFPGWDAPTPLEAQARS